MESGAIFGGLQVADAPKPALWRRSVQPSPEAMRRHGSDTLRTLFTANPLHRNRRGGATAPARTLGRTSWMRGTGYCVGESAGARRSWQATDRGPRFRRTFEPAAA